MVDECKKLPIEQLRRGGYQPRREFAFNELQELAHSLKIQGLIQPIVVRPIEQHYEIIAGERRWRAAQMAGFTEVLCLIKKVNDEQAALLALIENVQRKDLNPIEEAESYERFHTEFKLNDATIALKVGKSRSAVSHSRRLLNLEFGVQDYIKLGKLQAGHGKVLASQRPTLQIMLATQAVNLNWSVKQLEEAIRNISTPQSLKAAPLPHLAHIERSLSKYLGSKVQVEGQAGKGVIKITYPNLDHLESILEKLGCVNIM